MDKLKWYPSVCLDIQTAEWKKKKKQVAESNVLYGTIYKNLNVKSVCCLWALTYVVK